jgi:acetyltransferase-like isoleucine patch superfamily enzyme
LIVSSFHYVYSLPASYDSLWPIFLRWLGAHVESDVKLSEIDTFLSYPTNLLTLERGVISFGGILLVPAEITMVGNYRVDYIVLGEHTNLGNGCSILPGARLTSQTMVSNLTRISRETNSHREAALIGIPARVVPFAMSWQANATDQITVMPLHLTCLCHFMSKCLLLAIYLHGGLVGGSILHTTLICAMYRWRSYIRYKTIQYVIGQLRKDHLTFIDPFIGNTQWLIRLFRALGARIGNGVILSDFSCLTDYDLITIGDHVRLNTHANIQVTNKFGVILLFPRFSSILSIYIVS